MAEAAPPVNIQIVDKNSDGVRYANEPAIGGLQHAEILAAKAKLHRVDKKGKDYEDMEEETSFSSPKTTLGSKLNELTRRDLVKLCCCGWIAFALVIILLIVAVYVPLFVRERWILEQQVPSTTVTDQAESVSQVQEQVYRSEDRLPALELQENNFTALEQNAGCHSLGLEIPRSTFPDIDYALYGYNILKGFPLADGRDPGLTRPIFKHKFSKSHYTSDCRYNIPKGLTAVPDVSCVTSFSSTTVQSSYDYQQAISARAHVSGGIFGISFSASGGYQRAVSIVSRGQASLILSSAHCNYYFTKLNRYDMPEPSEELEKWMLNLKQMLDNGDNVDDTVYYELLDYFGTHFSVETLFGARYTLEYMLEASKREATSSHEFSLNAQASFSGWLARFGVGFSLTDSQKEAAKKFLQNVDMRAISVGAPPPADGDATAWASDVKDTPVPVELSLVPIYNLFDPTFAEVKFFNSTMAEKILGRLRSLTLQYCLRLAGQGVQIECVERSIVKFENFGIRFGNSDYEEKVIANENGCIDECYRRTDCFIVSWSSTCKLLTTTPKDTSVFLSLKKDTSSSVFVILAKVSGKVRVHPMRYKSGERNKLSVEGFGDGNNDESYQRLTKLCEYACKEDSLCTSFAVNTDITYAYNCATYTSMDTANVEFKDDRNGNFDIQLLSESGKEAVMKELLNDCLVMDSVSVEGNGKTKVITSHLNDSDTFNSQLCQEQCHSDSACVLSSFEIPESNKTEELTCTLYFTDSTTFTVKSSTIGHSATIFYERIVGDWKRITNLGRNCSSSLSATELDCKKSCTNRLFCSGAAWKDSHCKLYIQSGSSETTPCPFIKESESVFLIPTLETVVDSNRQTAK